MRPTTPANPPDPVGSDARATKHVKGSTRP